MITYYYATATAQGKELGIVRYEDVEYLSQHLDQLMAKHRPDDGRLLLWSGAGVWSGQVALLNLLGRGFDPEELAWERERLDV